MLVGMARIHYEIPEDIHRRAKAEAALQGITLRDFVIQALEKAVPKGSASRRSR